MPVKIVSYLRNTLNNPRDSASYLYNILFQEYAQQTTFFFLPDWELNSKK